MGRFRRRQFLAALAGTAISVPLIRGAQSAENVPRVGWLSPGTSKSHGHHLVAFKKGLTDLGYQVGTTILVEERWANGKLNAVPELARELVALDVRAIVVGSTPVTVRVSKVTSSVPIVHATGVNPMIAGLANDLAKPGGNVTGITTLSESLVPKLVQLAHEAVPRARRVCVIYNPTNTNASFFVDQVYQAGASYWEAAAVPIRVREDLPQISRALEAMKPDAALVLPDPILLALRRDIVKRLNETRTPATFGFSEFVEAGGLMSYGVYLPGNYRRAASFVDRILKGAAAGNLPIEQPREFELVVNLRTAQALGVTLPQSILLRADRVIE